MKAGAYSIYKKIKQYILEHAMLAPGDGVVAGVSGGADSMCLLHILCALRQEYALRLFVVHVHHGIRGADADADAAFVCAECGRLGVFCKVVHADVPVLAKEWGCSQEEAGRRVRYRAFCEAVAAYGCQKIAVAHNQNDNAETFLFQAFRGSGVKGLAGIAPCRAQGQATIIRPLLGVGRAQIEAYLEAEQGAYRTDATNFTPDYARNRIRNEILPLAQRSVNEGTVRHLAETAGELYELAGFLEELTGKAYQKVARETNPRADLDMGKSGSPPCMMVSLDALAWGALPAFLQKEVVLYAIGRMAGSRRDIGRVHVQAVCALMRGAAGKRVQLPYGLLAVRTYDAVQIARGDGTKEAGMPRRTFWDIRESPCGEAAEGAGIPKYPYLSSGFIFTITTFPTEIPLGAYTLTLKRLEHGTEEFEHVYSVFSQKRAASCGTRGQKNEKNSLIPKNCYTKCFDYAKIKNTLVLRTRQAGDYVVIHRDGNSKPLKSLLIDQKVPRQWRDSLPVLAAERSVLWAIGVRSGEGFHVTGDTKQILVAELRRKERNCNGRED